jgi:lactoylglutathione lyase
MKKKLLPFFLLILFHCSQPVFAQNDMKPRAVINHLAIYVVDLQKSGYFYEHIIGLDTIPEPFHDGKHLWLRMGAGSSLHIIQGAGSKKEYYKNNHICFSVQSMEDFTDKLKKKGISYEDVSGNKNTISKRPDGVKQIWLQDPDGYWIEINDAKE